ncbi:ATP-binding protein [Chondrinema litorale]|uniref:sensor histidine kinase n=1 Tax=Chondrinema litorale TaxID=2994555 RepID=UPI0025428641|nr:ATP-binding protein [Chondrinema litorale]UZR95600.1 histidine kinase [Chondrinema litorale]
MQLKPVNDQQKKQRIDKQAFKRLLLLYSLAVAAIALVVIVSERYLQFQLNRQLYDSRVVNLAGRQRAYSQQIAKDLLIISLSEKGSDRRDALTDLKNSLEIWTKTHYALMYGDSALHLPQNNTVSLDEKFERLTVIQLAISASALEVIVKLEEDMDIPVAEITPAIKKVMELEKSFLNDMDEIVKLYEILAKRKVERAKNIQSILAIISLIILVLEVFFIFRPVALYVRGHLRTLLHSEWLLKRTVQKSERLQKSLEESNKDLRNIHFALEEATLFARAFKNGEIYYISENFLDSLQFDPSKKFTYNLFNLINLKDWINELAANNAERSVWRSELKVRTYNNSTLWLDARIVPVFNEVNELHDLLIICSDITNRKWAEQKVYQLNREKYLRKAAEQRENSIRIIDALEKERKRVSRDIHDGLGQLLTALKFNIQSINLLYLDKAQTKLDIVKEQIPDIIRETRRLSFNLAPGNLEDYGIASALKTLALEVKRHTGVNVEFHNKTDFTGRIDRNLEVNLYRISQEAINNAVKHANPKYISVSIEHSEDLLEVIVEDDGEGFEEKKFLRGGRKYAGTSGILNMKERISFFGGNFNMTSKPGKGTAVRITLPFKNMLSV